MNGDSPNRESPLAEDTSADPNAKVRLRVRVLPVTYVLELGRYEWDGLTEEERACIVYDATEENCKFETRYEVIP